MAHFDRDRFLGLVADMPLVSIDLLLEDGQGRFLVGRRCNRPAMGSLFVPGGRILKDERLSDALLRIVRRELGMSVPVDGWVSFGLYEHFYEDNFSGDPGVTTHYVVLPHHRRTEGDAPVIESDDQHEEMCWLTPTELLSRSDVHPNTRAYFIK